ncbi:MAG: hypothetical protein ACTSVK_05850 [Promethearchaeota archaeon]
MGGRINFGREIDIVVSDFIGNNFHNIPDSQFQFKKVAVPFPLARGNVLVYPRLIKIYRDRS